MSVNSKMTALANEIRNLKGLSDKLTLDSMASTVRDANSEVVVQSQLISEITNILNEKITSNHSIVTANEPIE